MKKFDRVIATLITLQTRHVVKGQELAEKFDVSLRTVYRDIRSLENAGIPVYGEAGVGYSLVEGYKLPPVSFEENEALALLMAEKFLVNLVDTKTQKSYQSAVDKIKTVVRSVEKDSMQRVEESVNFQLSGNSVVTNNYPFLQDLIRCISVHRMVEVEYSKPNDVAPEKRKLEPIGCYYRYSSWYLIAWCHLRNAYRTFRVDRVQSVRMLEESFDDVHPSLNQYLEKEMEGQETIKIVVDFHSSIARFTGNQKYTFGLVKEEKKDDFVQMTFLSPSFFGIGQWLLGFTNYIHIIEPPELNTYMKELVEDLKDHYSS